MSIRSSPGRCRRIGGGSGRRCRACRAGHRRPAGILGALAILVGSGLIGLAGGLLWTHLAPRAVYVVVARGSADVVNPETSAFIAADAWYCLIGAIGGLIIGLAGYLFAVRRYGPVPMAAILAGSVIAGIAARWVGEHQGLHQFDRQLLTVHQGTLLHAPLALAGDTIGRDLAAGCLAPGGSVLAAGGLRRRGRDRASSGVLRDRSAARSARPSQQGPPQFPSYPGQ